MRLKHCFLFTLLLAGFKQTTTAQLTTSYAFGNILPDAKESATFSGPVVIDGNNACFSVKNGVPLFDDHQKGNGKFMMYCETGGNSEFVFESFPNPVSTYTRVFANGKINKQEDFQLIILNAKGLLMQTVRGKLAQFEPGLLLNFSTYTDGFYLIKVKTITTEKTFKIIKIRN
ncbi:MAG: T9SS type A sorting domain-containing protein [Bacteroidetes bacterium]|nr:T9SS type A sorting domain-containing protein [Bacteroidota bacterium]